MHCFMLESWCNQIRLWNTLLSRFRSGILWRCGQTSFHTISLTIKETVSLTAMWSWSIHSCTQTSAWSCAGLNILHFEMCGSLYSPSFGWHWPVTLLHICGWSHTFSPHWIKMLGSLFVIRRCNGPHNSWYKWWCHPNDGSLGFRNFPHLNPQTSHATPCIIHNKSPSCLHNGDLTKFESLYLLTTILSSHCWILSLLSRGDQISLLHHVWVFQVDLKFGIWTRNKSEARVAVPRGDHRVRGVS